MNISSDTSDWQGILLFLMQMPWVPLCNRTFLVNTYRSACCVLSWLPLLISFFFTSTEVSGHYAAPMPSNIWVLFWWKKKLQETLLTSDIFQTCNTHRDADAFSHGSWVASNSRSCKAFRDLSSELTQHHLCHTLYQSRKP